MLEPEVFRWIWSFCFMVLMSKDLLLSGALSSLFWLLVGARSLNSHLLMFFMEILNLLRSVAPAFSPYLAHVLFPSLMSLNFILAVDVKSRILWRRSW